MKKMLFSIIYGAMLIVFSVYVLLEIYVLPDDGLEVKNPQSSEHKAPANGEMPDFSIYVPEDKTVLSSDVYDDGSIKITLTTYREYDTTIYVADIQLSSADLLKTAFANDRYGKNIKEKTSVIAESKSAILAINGDYYSAREGCVLRNGTLYRDFGGDDGDEALVIYADGSVGIADEGDGSGKELLDNGAMQILSFGPALIKNGDVSVTQRDEVDKAMADNPRTAFVYYDKLHYAFVVGDGRTNESKGLSLYQLANFLKDLGAVNAYNLDGGGSSTMYFNGRVINNPTTNGKKISEREVSDIVYIGYNY